MKTKELFEKLSVGQLSVGQILECLPDIEKIETDPDTGMRFRLKDIRIHDEDNNPYYEVVGDFGAFEEFNKPLAKANYYDGNGNPTLTWMQQPTYNQAKHALNIYLDPKDDVFKVVSNDVYEKFLKDDPGCSYIEWLERVARASFSYDSERESPRL